MTSVALAAMPGARLGQIRIACVRLNHHDHLSVLDLGWPRDGLHAQGELG
jgi:hypothetical protein